MLFESLKHTKKFVMSFCYTGLARQPMYGSYVLNLMRPFELIAKTNSTYFLDWTTKISVIISDSV